MKNIKKLVAVLTGCVLAFSMIAGCTTSNPANTEGAAEQWVTDVKDMIKYLYDSNAYIQVVIGEEDYIYMIHNPSKEIVAETTNGGVAIYRNDHKVVAFSDKVNIEYDLAPLEFLDYTLNAYTAGIAGITVEKEESDELNTYVITVPDKDSIKKIYAQLDESLANTTVDGLFEGMEEATTTQMRVTISLNSEQKTMGAAVEFVVDEQLFTSWYFDGYAEMFDWQLPEDWYKDDNEEEIWIDLANTLMATISDGLADVFGSAAGSISMEKYYGLDDESKAEAFKTAVEQLKELGYTVDCTATELQQFTEQLFSEADSTVDLVQAARVAGVANKVVSKESSDLVEAGDGDIIGDIDGIGDIGNTGDAGDVDSATSDQQPNETPEVSTAPTDTAEIE